MIRKLKTCRFRSLLLVLAVLPLHAGCDLVPIDQIGAAGESLAVVVPATGTVGDQAPQSEPPSPPVEAEQPPEPFTGDLDGILERGRLRILVPANIGGVFYLPREGWPVEAQREAAESFALSQGLQPEFVPVPSFQDLIPALVSGHGDVIAANLTVTQRRREKISFSVPLTTVKQQLIVSAGNEEIKRVSDLRGKRVMVGRGTSFWERLGRLNRKYRGIEVIARPHGLSDEEELDKIVRGEIDASIRDSNIAAMYLAYRGDLKVAFSLPGTDDIAWGIRKDAVQLEKALNKFLHLELSAEPSNTVHAGDLDEIKRRRTLRVLLRNNAASYFLYKGELHGFEYELARAFAKANHLRLEVIVPDSHAALLEWLKDGRGDIAAGFLEPRELDGIRFSRPYHYAPRHLIVAKDSPVGCSRDLAGMTVTVRRSSPYWKDLEALQAKGIDFQIRAAAEDAETEQLIAQVAAGEIEATVADGHLLGIELARGLGVRSGFTMSQDRAHAVAVREDNPELLAALDEYIRKSYKGSIYNILYRKYFENRAAIRNLASGRPGGRQWKGFSPYDESVRRYSERYGFDWRLIIAQMYQESRFDPKAKSFAGALGLMQVMPRTAKFMGFESVERPDDGIHAGVKYMDWVRNQFEPSLPVDERTWFTLAAYNAGHGHVDDARRLARQQGWDGDVWFDNTERAMLLLSKKQYARKARYGWVRGIEPVTYVRNIRHRYRAYAELGEEIAAVDCCAADPRGEVDVVRHQPAAGKATDVLTGTGVLVEAGERKGGEERTADRRTMPSLSQALSKTKSPD